MLQTSNPTSPFKKRLKELLKEYDVFVSLKSMGTTEDWKEEIIWNNEIIVIFAHVD